MWTQFPARAMNKSMILDLVRPQSNDFQKLPIK